ncbi:UDP-glucose 6-dehydrogenase TuaD [compost metagenome]
MAVLGLTFKAGTDDLREAASLENIPLLLEQGADIYAYDPIGVENFAKRYPQGKRNKGSINYVTEIEHALDGANVCFIFTEWGEIKAVSPETYKKYMRTPLVFDGRNIYDVELMQEAGIEYHSIGRKATSGKDIKEGNNNELQYS